MLPIVQELNRVYMTYDHFGSPVYQCGSRSAPLPSFTVTSNDALRQVFAFANHTPLLAVLLV